MLKGSRYVLLKNEDNLTEQQHNRLDAILELIGETGRVFDFHSLRHEMRFT